MQGILVANQQPIVLKLLDHDHDHEQSTMASKDGWALTDTATLL